MACSAFRCRAPERRGSPFVFSTSILTHLMSSAKRMRTVELSSVARIPRIPWLFTASFDTLCSPPHRRRPSVSPHDRVWRVFTSCGRGGRTRRFALRSPIKVRRCANREAALVKPILTIDSISLSFSSFLLPPPCVRFVNETVRSATVCFRVLFTFNYCTFFTSDDTSQKKGSALRIQHSAKIQYTFVT